MVRGSGIPGPSNAPSAAGTCAGPCSQSGQPGPPPPPPPPPVDVYDEEFNNNLEIAKNLIKEFKRPTDRAICKKWLRKLVELRSGDPVVKRNRNSFFKYMVFILHKALKDNEQFGTDKAGSKNDEQFTSRWSADRKTYIAAKPLPGRGVMVYLAVSKDPTLGWDHA